MTRIYTFLPGLTILAALALAAAPKAAHAQGYSFTTIDDPNATVYLGTTAQGINDSGQVVGDYFNGSLNAYIDDDGTLSSINDPSRTGYNSASGINNAGDVVGSYDDNNGEHGYVETANTFTAIDYPTSGPSIDTYANGINNFGQIVGYYLDNSDPDTYHGFVDTANSFTTIDGPAGSLSTFATGINDMGQIVGAYEDSSYTDHGFIISGTTFSILDDPLGTRGTAITGINDEGEVVGYFYDSSGQGQGFVEEGGTFTTLDDPNTSTDANGSNYTLVNGINNNGQVVGAYTANGSDHGFIATPVATPEPSAFIGLGIGLLGLGALGVKARKRLTA